MNFSGDLQECLAKNVDYCYAFLTMIQFQREAAQILTRLLTETGLTEDQIFQLLEKPKVQSHGDLAFPCFQAAKFFKKPPNVLAQELSEKLQASGLKSFSWAKPSGPYINFSLSPDTAFSIAESVFIKKEKFGQMNWGQGKKILVEYSSPNVAKELHIGHFRNTILGQSLVNIYKAAGYHTIALNHLGDWGSQFGRVAYGYLKWGKEEDLKIDPLQYLMSLYVKVNAAEETDPSIDREARLLFRKIETGDPELTALWKKFCTLSIEGLQKIYQRLGVQFDHVIGESFYVDKIPALLDSLRAKNLLQESAGAQVVFLGDDIPPCLILTGDGTTLYGTRDIAAAIWRQKEFSFDQNLYVVGSEQQLHFKQVFGVLKLMGFSWSEQLQHVAYGLYRFKDGKFSTRKGKIILAEEVLNEARDKAIELIEKKNPNLKDKQAVAEMVGVGAVIFNDLSTDRQKDVEFDWEKILDFDGDTGPYLQYTYARASSILRNAEAKGFLPQLPKNSSVLRESEATLTLLKTFGYLEASILGAVRLNKPSIIANYAIDLAKAFNGFYREVRVLEEQAGAAEVSERLGVVQAFRQVLANTLTLLCMKAPTEM